MHELYLSSVTRISEVLNIQQAIFPLKVLSFLTVSDRTSFRSMGEGGRGEGGGNTKSVRRVRNC